MPRNDTHRRIHAMAEPAQADEFVTIEAAVGQRVRVKGVAYAGGPMKLSGWAAPVVVDLSGFQIPASVPLLANHENHTGSRVGLVSARVENHTLMIDGEILSSSGLATGIVEQARAGAEWQLSVGVDVQARVLVQDSKTVNGRVQSGPFCHVTQSVLREVSVVAVGADASTKMKLAAKFNLYGGMDMEFEKWLEKHKIDAAALSEEHKTKLQAAFDVGDDPPKDVLDAMNDGGDGDGDDKKPEPKPAKAQSKKPVKAKVKAARQSDNGDGDGDGDEPMDVRAEAEGAIKAERERVAAVQDLCAGEFKKIEAQALREGWTLEATGQKVLEAMRANRPQAFNVNTGGSQCDERKVIEAAMCMRVGIDEKALVASYGEQVMEAARPDRDLSLQELVIHCARIEGKTLPRAFGNETIRAAFSTVSLPGILNSVANKRLLKSYDAQRIVATKVCSAGDLNDFKESERYRLTDVGDLTQVAQDGELKHGGVSEEKATNQLETYGKMFALTRQMIFNDDLGAFLRVPDGMGARAARKIDQLFFTRLLSNPTQTDAVALFHADHANYQEGAATALDGDSLGTAIQLFLDQTDSDSQPINIEPKFLLVPTALKRTAMELLNSTFLMSVGSAAKQRIPTYNALADENLQIITSAYLSNSNYTGYSALAWYLFADPAVADTFEIGYLKGKRAPTIEKGDTDFNTLGIQFRVYFDLGVREQDTRGMIKSKGEA